MLAFCVFLSNLFNYLSVADYDINHPDNQNLEENTVTTSENISSLTETSHFIINVNTIDQSSTDINTDMNTEIDIDTETLSNIEYNEEDDLKNDNLYNLQKASEEIIIIRETIKLIKGEKIRKENQWFQKAKDSELNNKELNRYSKLNWMGLEIELNKNKELLNKKRNEITKLANEYWGQYGEVSSNNFPKSKKVSFAKNIIEEQEKEEKGLYFY